MVRADGLKSENPTGLQEILQITKSTLSRGILPKNGGSILTTSNESINHFVRYKFINLHNQDSVLYIIN
jgi:hypothetical protein